LIKSSGSVGANYEEAQSGSSSADFIFKVEISLREMKESNYWLRLINEITCSLPETEKKELDYLIDESEQLSKILGSIVVKVKKRTLN
jgi:four helix bundle protein